MNKLVKLLALVAMTVGMVGCASVDSLNKKTVSKSKDGVLYGVAWIADSQYSVQKTCDDLNLNDVRCKNKDNYELVVVFSKFGFSDGAVGVTAFVDKKTPNVELLNNRYVTGDKNSVYVKVMTKSGGIGEVVEVVSAKQDGKCHWYGMPKAGGTVCPAYGYDYRKDYTGTVLSNM